MKYRSKVNLVLGSVGIFASSFAFAHGGGGGGGHAGGGHSSAGGGHHAAPAPRPPEHHTAPAPRPPEHHASNNPTHPSQPSHPGHGQPTHPDHGQPTHPDHGQPTHPDHGQPTHPDHGQPSHPGHGQPTHPDHGQPSHPDHGQPSHPTTVTHQPAGAVRHSTHLPDGTQKIEHNDGHISYTDHNGNVTKSVFGGTRITYNSNGSQTINSGNRVFNQSISVHNNMTVMQRNYNVHSSFLGHNLVYSSHYEGRYCSYWHSPVLFYSTALTLGALNYGFFGPSYGYSYQPLWGYNYWNNYSWSGYNGYSWYNHYSSFYWRPYGYWQPHYRPSYALVDWLFSSTLDYAWEERMEAARELARQRNEDLALQAESDEEAEEIRARIDEEVEAAVQVAIEDAKASIEDNASDTPLIDQDTQTQFANQVEQIASDRQNNVTIDAAFENALKDLKHLFLVQTNSDKQYDDGANGQCKLSAGDILQQDSSFTSDPSTGLLGLRVKVGHPDSCRAGSTIIMTAEDLAAIYNALHEQMDVGAKQLADANQPKGSMSAHDEL